MNESLTTQAADQLVPPSYAEKARASLMQLRTSPPPPQMRPARPRIDGWKTW